MLCGTKINGNKLVLILLWSGGLVGVCLPAFATPPLPPMPVSRWIVRSLQADLPIGDLLSALRSIHPNKVLILPVESNYPSVLIEVANSELAQVRTVLHFIKFKEVPLALEIVPLFKVIQSHWIPSLSGRATVDEMSKYLWALRRENDLSARIAAMASVSRRLQEYTYGPGEEGERKLVPVSDVLPRTFKDQLADALYDLECELSGQYKSLSAYQDISIGDEMVHRIGAVSFHSPLDMNFIYEQSAAAVKGSASRAWEIQSTREQLCLIGLAYRYLNTPRTLAYLLSMTSHGDYAAFENLHGHPAEESQFFEFWVSMAFLAYSRNAADVILDTSPLHLLGHGDPALRELFVQKLTSLFLDHEYGGREEIFERKILDTLQTLNPLFVAKYYSPRAYIESVLEFFIQVLEKAQSPRLRLAALRSAQHLLIRMKADRPILAEKYPELSVKFGRLETLIAEPRRLERRSPGHELLPVSGCEGSLED